MIGVGPAGNMSNTDTPSSMSMSCHFVRKEGYEMTLSGTHPTCPRRCYLKRRFTLVLAVTTESVRPSMLISRRFTVQFKTETVLISKLKHFIVRILYLFNNRSQF